MTDQRSSRAWGACRLLVAAWVTLVGCQRKTEPPPAEPPPLVVEFTGCAAVRLGQICELGDDRALRLWIDAPGDATLSIDKGAGAAALPQTSEVQGGRLVALEVDEEASAVVVSASRAGASTSYRLIIAPRVIEPALAAAESLRNEGKLDEAEDKLSPLLEDPRDEPRILAKRMLARIERARGRATRAAQLFEEILPEEREKGWISHEASDRLALAFSYLFPDRRLKEARRALDGLADIESQDPHWRAIAPYFRGLVAYEGGDLRSALDSFREAAKREERLDLRLERINALEPMADTLAMLGRYSEAEALLREAEAVLSASPNGAACRRVRLLNSIGWLAIRAASGDAFSSERALPDPITPLKEALTLYHRQCREPANLANLLTNLAIAEVERNRPAEARDWLVKARKAEPSPGLRLEVWWMLVEGQIALSEKKAGAALRAFERLGLLGDQALMPELEFEGAYGRARAFEALGQVDRARKAYIEAEEQLDAWSRLVPLGEGRDTFLARYEQVSRSRLEFLLRRPGQSSLEEAALVARQARVRMLASLRWVERISALPAEARARWEEAIAAYRSERAALDAKAASDWKLPTNQLQKEHAERKSAQARLRAALERALSTLGPRTARYTPKAPQKGELLLVYHPLRDGWLGFAITDAETEMRRLGSIELDAPDSRLADALLQPFGAKIAEAQRIRLSAYGPLERRDLHALPFRGRPLVAHAPVAYAVDLPPSGADMERADNAHPRALLIADPRGDLPAARREAKIVATSLGHASFTLERFDGAAATHAAVRDALERPLVDLIHYAGHGAFQGHDGWESGLLLAQGGRLTIGDVMALRRVPPRIILSGCETARTSDSARVTGLGLAQAFLIAGAESVVASTRPIDDRLAEQIFMILYQARDAGAGALLADPAASLRAAQMAAYEARSSADWASFRVLVR